MKQDRIRIYELSKELNLDNQELLALCAQLNIAAKSHSSTISEFDADHLRVIAKKQDKSVSHQQQILGIRHFQPLEQPKSQPSVSPLPKSTVGSAVVSRPPAADSRKLTTPNQLRGKPELAKPLVKPMPSVASKPRKNQEKSATLRRDRIKQMHHKSLETTQKKLAKKPVRPTSDKQADVQQPPERESVTTQPLPELRRPKPAPSLESETPAVTLLPKPIRVTTEPKELLEPPKPPRFYKKGKKRRLEEFNEERETKAKAVTRVKHQLRLVELESEEDWETAKLPRDLAKPVSLAMERPAKSAGR